jgi:hypothetical protein
MREMKFKLNWNINGHNGPTCSERLWFFSSRALQTAMPIFARAFKNHTLHKSSKKFIYKDPP